MGVQVKILYHMVKELSRRIAVNREGSLRMQAPLVWTRKMVTVGDHFPEAGHMVVSGVST